MLEQIALAWLFPFQRLEQFIPPWSNARGKRPSKASKIALQVPLILLAQPSLILFTKAGGGAIEPSDAKTALASLLMNKCRIKVDKSGFKKSMEAKPVTICIVEADREAQSAGLQTFREQKLSFLRLIFDSRAPIAPHRLQKEQSHNYEIQKH